MGFHARDQSPISVFGWRGGGMLVVAKLLEMRRRLSYNKCSVVQRDGLIAGTGSARFTAGARKIVFRCPEQLEVRFDQSTL